MDTPKKIIYFLTGNKNKAKEVQQILGNEFEVRPISEDELNISLPEEIQDVDASAVVYEKCKAASLALAKSRVPVLVEDTSLAFDGMKGLPGAFVKHFLEKIGNDGLVHMLDSWQNKGAKAICAVAYTEGPCCQIHVFEGVVQGCIVPPRGDGWGWDPIFQPCGVGEKTFAELDPNEKNMISHRRKAIEQLRDYLRSRRV